MNKQTSFYRLCIPTFIIYLLLANVSFSQIDWKLRMIEKDIHWGHFELADVDNDGDPDLFTSNGDILLWYENLQQGWTRHIIDPSFPNLCSLIPFDIDRDG